MAPDHYDKAPIIEAIIDLRVTVPSGTSAISIAEGLSALRDRFPKRQEMPALPGLQFQFGPNAASIMAAGPSLGGIRYTSKDKQRMVQARIDGFVFSLLPQYDRWESFRDEAKELWDIYRKACNPLKVTRAAIRYVNRFDLPGDQPIELKDYFSTFPEVSGRMSQSALNGFSLQLHIPQPDIKAMLILNQARVPPPMEDMVSILLDIDLFRENMELEATDEEQLWGLLEQMRVRKNEVFEASITDKSREVIR